MDINPKTSSQFVGNIHSVKALRTWIETIIKDPRTPKRVCFLTGPIGSGKSVLARLILKEHGFSIREIESSDLRTKQARNVLVQTMSFHDVLALLRRSSSISSRVSGSSQNSKEFRKAIVIDDFENIGLAKQEVYRCIRDLFRSKKTVGVPVIFTGVRAFRGKKPLTRNSVFIHLKARSHRENLKVIRHFISVLIRKTRSESLIKLSENSEEQLKLARDCGGDVRHVLNHLELVARQNRSDIPLQMNVHEQKGPLHALWRIMNIDNNRDIHDVISDIDTEGMTIPFGLHSSYIHHIPWMINRSSISDKHKTFSNLLKECSKLIADYGRILDKERSSGCWGIREIGNILSCWGYRVKNIKSKTNTNISSKKSSPKFKGRDFWWVSLEKGVRQGDTSVNTPCMSKTFRASLVTYQLQNMSFQMLNQRSGGSRSWKPGTNRRTIELLRLSSVSVLYKDRLIGLTCVKEP